MTYGQTPSDPFAAEPQPQPQPHAVQQVPPPYQPAPPAYQSAPGYAPSPAGYGQPAPGAPQYGAPSYPAYAAYGARPDPKNWMGIVALVGGILGLIFVVPFLGSLAGIIFGHLGLGAVKRGEANNRGLALAGTILGYVGMAIMVVVVIAYIALFAWAAQEGWTEGSISA